MRKIYLDLNEASDKKSLHAYLKERFGFPEHYGANLDALFDCLTEIAEPTAVGFFLPTPDNGDLDIDYLVYLDRVKQVFIDAEEVNGNLAVIFGDITDNYEEEEPDDLYTGPAPGEDGEDAGGETEAASEERRAAQKAAREQALKQEIDRLFGV